MLSKKIWIAFFLFPIIVSAHEFPDVCDALQLPKFRAYLQPNKKQIVTYRTRKQLSAFDSYRKQSQSQEDDYNTGGTEDIAGCFETTSRKICTRYTISESYDLNQDGLKDYLVDDDSNLGLYGGAQSFIFFSSKNPGYFCLHEGLQLSSPIKPKLTYNALGFSWQVVSVWYRPDQNPECLTEQFGFFDFDPKNPSIHGKYYRMTNKVKLDYRIETKDPKYVKPNGQLRFENLTACEVNYWLEQEPKRLDSFCEEKFLRTEVPRILYDERGPTLEFNELGVVIPMIQTSAVCRKILTRIPEFEGAIKRKMFSGMSLQKRAAIEVELGRYYYRANFRNGISLENFKLLVLEDQNDSEYIKDAVANVKKRTNQNPVEPELKNYYEFILTLPDSMFLDEEWVRAIFTYHRTYCYPSSAEKEPLFIPNLERAAIAKVLSARKEMNNEKNALKIVNKWSLRVSSKALCVFEKYKDPNDPKRAEAFGIKN